MWLILVLFNAVLLSIAGNQTDNDSPWNHLKLRDVIEFAIPDVREKLSNAAKSIIPHPNVADNPLTKFVDANTIEVHMKRILLQDALVELKDTVNSEYTPTLMTAFIETFTFYLEESIQNRLQLLVEKEKERMSHQLKLAMSRVEKIIKPLFLDDVDLEYLLQNIIHNIKQSSMSNEIKKVVNYPIVRQELVRVLSTDFVFNTELIPFVMECLKPFLLQGIKQDDINVVERHSSEAAIDALKNVLRDQYMFLVKDALWKAQLLDSVLSQSYLEDNKISREFEKEYAMVLRQVLSIWDYTKSSIKDICSSTTVRRIEKTTIKAVTKSTIVDWKLNIAMGIEKPYIVFHNGYTTIIELVLNIKERCRQRTEIECNAYHKAHQSFTKENTTTLAEFAIKRLNTIHKDIKGSDIKILKKYIPEFHMLTTYYHNVTSDHYLSDKLKEIQKDIENEAIESYGFMTGMFTYSNPYFDILEAVFSQLSYSEIQDNSGIQSKSEL